MRKWSICKLVVIPILLIQNSLAAQELELLKTTHLADYPSASALEFYNNRLYVAGDDATSILILTANHKVVDHIDLFRSKEKRIDKKEKADLEASAIIRKDKEDYLVLLSSFSTRTRNKMVVLPLNRKKDDVHIATSRQPSAHVRELNIEGAAYINDQLVLSNRANNASRTNNLILTRLDLKDGIKEKKERVIAITVPGTKTVTGISELTYLQDRDILLFTASTENTSKAYRDGPIGESYIGFISGISTKLAQHSIKVDTLIPLSKILQRSDPQKIEAIAVEKNSGDELIVHLASDNDNGESTLFKVRLKLDGLN